MTTLWCLKLRFIVLNQSFGKKLKKKNKESLACNGSVLLNSALVHYLVSDRNVLNHEEVLAFVLATKKFRIYTTPIPQERDRVTSLEVLEGDLNFIAFAFLTYS